MKEKSKYIKELLNAYKSEVDNFNDAIFEDKFDALITDLVKLFAIPNEWVAIKEQLPLVDTFYLVASSNLQNWTKALYCNGEFHTIENIIDGDITHWCYVKPP